MRSGPIRTLVNLNPGKNQVLWLGSKFQIERVDVRQVPVLSSAVNVVDAARDLGVTIVSRLTMADRVSATCRSAYFQLRQQTRSLPMPQKQSYRLPSCVGWTTVIRCCLASLMTNCSDYKAVQNAAARLASGARHSDHITPVLRQLHYRPVKQRVEYKLATLTYKTVHGLLPSYLAGDCQLVTATGRRQLRSSDIPTLVVHRTSTRFGDRCFLCAAARIWNRLPSSLRDPEVTYGQFCRPLLFA